MLKLFSNELRKLLTKRIAVVVVILLAVNLLSLHFTANKSAEDYERLEPHLEVFEEVERVCSEDPEFYAAYFEMLEQDYKVKFKEWDANQPIFPPLDENGVPIQLDTHFEYTSPSTIIEGYEDYDILDLYHAYSSDFRTALGGSVDNAKSNLELLDRFGIKTDTSTGNYQRKLIELYSDILEKSDQTPSIVRGWDEFLTYENRLIFLFLAAMLIAVQIALTDRESGFEPVLRTCRHGRWQVAASKCVTLVIAMAGTAILMNLSELFYIWLRYGLSSPMRSIQNVSEFVFSPYAMSILDTALLGLMGMILAASLLGAIALLLTALTRQVILPLFISGLLVLANLLLHWISILGDWRVFNIVEPASGRLLMRTPVIALQGLGKSLYPIEMVMFFGLFVIVCIVAVIVYHLRRPTSKVKNTARIATLVEKLTRRRGGARKLKLRRPSLMLGELRKWVSPLLILAILVLVGVRLQQTSERFEVSENDVEARMRAYAEQYGGVMTEEKAALVKAEYDYAVELTNPELQQQYMTDYAVGQISADEYFAYQLEYAKVSASLPVLSEVYSHVSYLRNKAVETGLETQFFYDGGYEDFFGTAVDLPLYLLVLLGMSAIFAKEYANDASKGGFMQILRTTRNGRRPVFIRKFALALIYSGGLSLIFNILDLVLLAIGEGLPALDAPLVSMERYSAVSGGITVGGYLVFCIALRLLGTLILALLTTTFSCLVKNTKLVLSLTAAVTLLPYALYYFGLRFTRYLDFTTLLSGDRLWQITWETGNIAVLVIFVGVCAIVTAGLTAASYKKFCD